MTRLKALAQQQIHAAISSTLSLGMKKMAEQLAQSLLDEPAIREELNRLAQQGVKRVMRDPLFAWPVILTLKEVATIYRLAPSTIRSKVQHGTFSPRPWEKYPYRWRREDVSKDLKRWRGERPRRPHGFATPRR